MQFRYFDLAGNQITMEQLRSMRVMTPTMNHVLATVLERLEKDEKSRDRIEKIPSK